MTNEPTPDAEGFPDQPVNPATDAAVGPPGGEPPTSAAPKPGGRRAVIIVGAIVVFLAVVLFVVRNNVSADDLAVGDCFNTPNGTTIQTVEKHPCNESHNAEVIFVGEYSGDSYPISLSLDSYIDDSCVPAFESYVGRSLDSDPELSISYFYPTRDGWDSGDRTVTCYVTQPDESPMTESLKG